MAPKPPCTGHWAALRDGSGGDGGDYGRVGGIYYVVEVMVMVAFLGAISMLSEAHERKPTLIYQYIDEKTLTTPIPPLLGPLQGPNRR